MANYKIYYLLTAPLALGKDRIECEGRFAGTRNPCYGNDFIMRQA